ncbi:hypothetical protein BC829DRAFT_385384 [Chytridium lagenaria]|nr:hypothetical protein BC829DRAFT_385384 [Chytridium lagenaria]
MDAYLGYDVEGVAYRMVLSTSNQVNRVLLRENLDRQTGSDSYRKSSVGDSSNAHCILRRPVVSVIYCLQSCPQPLFHLSPLLPRCVSRALRRRGPFLDMMRSLQKLSTDLNLGHGTRNQISEFIFCDDGRLFDSERRRSNVSSITITRKASFLITPSAMVYTLTV